MDGLSYTCRACVRARCKSHYLANKKKYKDRAHIWAAQNAVARKKIVHKSYARNKDKKAIYGKRWRELNPDRSRQLSRLSQAVRRSRIAGNGGAIRPDEWIALIELFETKICLYCHRRAPQLVMDHFIPVAKGGRTEAGNLLPCCSECNSKKGSSDPEVWINDNCRADTFSDLTRFLLVTKDALAPAKRGSP
jgi:5-methylcytosine-specific restriction endonuclease McrA